MRRKEGGGEGGKKTFQKGIMSQRTGVFGAMNKPLNSYCDELGVVINKFL